MADVLPDSAQTQSLLEQIQARGRGAWGRLTGAHPTTGPERGRPPGAAGPRPAPRRGPGDPPLAQLRAPLQPGDRRPPGPRPGHSQQAARPGVAPPAEVIPRQRPDGGRAMTDVA